MHHLLKLSRQGPSYKNSQPTQIHHTASTLSYPQHHVLPKTLLLLVLQYNRLSAPSLRGVPCVRIDSATRLRLSSPKLSRILTIGHFSVIFSQILKTLIQMRETGRGVVGLCMKVFWYRG